jgi:hypothetical protein
MLSIWSISILVGVGILLARYLCGKLMLEGSMLLFGMVFYCFIPFFAFGSGIYELGPGAEIWEMEFSQIFAAEHYAFALFILYYFSFKFGWFLPSPSLGARFNTAISDRYKYFFAVALTLSLLYFGYNARDMFGAGYALEYNHLLMGPLATTNLLLTLVCLNIRQWEDFKLFNKEIIFVFLLTLNSLLLLSMGGRMYVIIPVVAFFLQQINKEPALFQERLKYLVRVLCFLVVFIFVGVWRLGADFGSDLKFWDFIVTSLGESILTSISLASYFQCKDLPFFQIPFNYLGSFFNLMPSFVFPTKSSFIPELDPLGTCVYSPFGATHIGAALIINFGVIGTFIYFVAFGFVFKSFRKVQKNGWWLHYYFCSLLPFMFFRDGFVIFNKAFMTGLIFAFFVSKKFRLG